MKHNAEADACDLLMEIENVEILVDYVEKDTVSRHSLLSFTRNDTLSNNIFDSTLRSTTCENRK